MEYSIWSLAACRGLAAVDLSAAGAAGIALLKQEEEKAWKKIEETRPTFSTAARGPNPAAPVRKFKKERLYRNFSNDTLLAKSL